MIKVENTELKLIEYPDGEKSIGNWDEIIENIPKSKRKIIFFGEPSKDYALELVLLSRMVKELRRPKHGIILKATYLPGEREDKTEKGRLNMEMTLNDLLRAFDEVKVPILHPNWNGFINENKPITIFDCYTLVVFPDESAFKRQKNVLQNSEIGGTTPYIVIKKLRNKGNGKILSQEIDGEKSYPKNEVEMEYFLSYGGVTKLAIVDDICSKGGTFVGALELVEPLFDDLKDRDIMLYTGYDENQPDKKGKYDHGFKYTLDFH